MNVPLVFVIASVAAVTAGFLVKAMRKPWLRSDDRAWIIGDSLGVGLLPKFKQLGNQNQIPVEGNPVGGTIIRQWAQKDLSEIQEWGATAVLVVLGSNDAASSEAYVQNEAQKHAEDLVTKLDKMGVKIWWLSPGQTGALKHSAEIRSMIERLSFYRNFVERSVPDWVEYSKFDYVHPTPKGYGELAEWIWSQWERT